jgi:hypothetical protein
LLRENAAGVVKKKAQNVVCSRKAFVAKMVFHVRIVGRERERAVGLDIVVKTATWIIMVSVVLMVVGVRIMSSLVSSEFAQRLACCGSFGVSGATSESGSEARSRSQVVLTDA